MPSNVIKYRFGQANPQIKTRIKFNLDHFKVPFSLYLFLHIILGEKQFSTEHNMNRYTQG